MRRRSYRDGSDLERLQAFNAAAFAETDGCGFLHPGDIPHRLFNGNKLFDPAEVLTIWESGGDIAAWVLVGPRHSSYDAQVRPDLRSGSFEKEVLEFAESETLRLMLHHGIESDQLEGTSFRCDEFRSRLLTESGWMVNGDNGDPPEVTNRRRLVDLEETTLPDGYLIRAVRGLEDAAALAQVHAASFGSTWTIELYERVMNSPGYAAEREFVVEAPDGTLAAFTETWHDHLNRTGLFEPVGTHHAHRRRGLGRSLLLFGMRAMAAAGMDHAIVGNLNTNEASSALYRNAGFTPWHLVDWYVKPVSN